MIKLHHGIAICGTLYRIFYRVKPNCFFIFFFFFFFFAVLRDLRDPSSPTRESNLGPPAVEVQSPNHWTTRELPKTQFFQQIYCKGKKLKRDGRGHLYFKWNLKDINKVQGFVDLIWTLILKKEKKDIPC